VKAQNFLTDVWARMRGGATIGNGRKQLTQSTKLATKQMVAPTTNLIDITRHISVFSPDRFGKRRVDVIGADAVGSNVVLALAMLGIDGIHVWDDSKVSSQDIAKGVYQASDLGKPRVEALRELVKRKTGCDIIVPHNEEADGSKPFGDVVFLLGGSIASRRSIWQNGIRNKLRTKLMIEPELGETELRVNVINPIKPAQVKLWEESALKADMSGWADQSCVSASLVAGLCVWQMMRWTAIAAGHEDSLDTQIVVPLSLAGGLDSSLQILRDKRITVIGAGATGSHVVLYLSMLGLTNIDVFDFDHVEAHNLANQAFMKADIGKQKVSAVTDLVRSKTGQALLRAHNERVDGSQELGDIVFLLTDTMASRKQIWQTGIKGKNRTRLMIETRMGVDEGRVYTIEPAQSAQITRFEDTLYDDAVAVASACGTSVSVGPTAMFLASLCLWQMLRWAQREGGGEGKLDNEILFGLRPLYFLPAKFE
jgi:molybdopterin/thiamine biosynthesis adenylyltransferase